MKPVSTVRLLATLIGGFRWRWLANAVLWTAIWMMPILAGLIVREFFDTIEGGPGFTISTLVVMMVAYSLGRIFVMFAAMLNDVHFMFRIGALLQRNMFTRILSLPGAQAVEEAPGEVITRFREDVEHVTETSSFTVDLAGALGLSIAAGVILVRIDATMTFVVFLPLMSVIFLAERARSRIELYRTRAREATGRVTEALGEAFGAVQSIKVAGAEAGLVAHLAQLNEERRHLMVRDRVLVSVLESMFWGTVQVGTGVVLLLAATRLNNGSLSLGDFALFVYFMGQGADVVYITGLFLARLRQAKVAFERMSGLMRGARPEQLVAFTDLELAGKLPALPEAPRTAAGELRTLEVRGLSFKYPGTDNGIADVDLDIDRGSFVVLTGRIGSGKTTLLRALLGLVTPDGGTVRWNGEEVDVPDRFFVPPHSAYTPQVPKLFSMTLRDNLLMGLGVSDDELMGAVRTAVMEPDLAQMRDGLDTEVGPRGVRLSGGQVQRTAAARMLVRRPDLLVFDDLSSALDVNTEKELWDGLLRDDPSITSLVVSHRLPALRRADQIIVMEQGRVAARGRFEELERDPSFRALLNGEADRPTNGA